MLILFSGLPIETGAAKSRWPLTSDKGSVAVDSILAEPDSAGRGRGLRADCTHLSDGYSERSAVRSWMLSKPRRGSS